jgi:DNA-binding GntR family transcriptional regulator
MISPGGDREGRDSVPSRTSSVSVLADRIAAALIHHEPGWRLPRLTALARRYNVSAAEVDAAIEELAARHLLRRLPDGQVYRASPAECQVPLAGLAGLLSRVDPMGGVLSCQRRQVSTRRVPEDVGRALGLAPGDSVTVIRCLWLVGGEPGALSATYLPARLGGLAGDFSASPLPGLGGADGQQPDRAAGQAGAEWPDEDGDMPASAGAAAPATGGPSGEDPASSPAGPAVSPAGPAVAGRPRAVQIELSPPSPSVARSLRLGAGQPVATVTVLFEEPSVQAPVALTVAMLRPDLFRIVVQAPDVDQPDIGREDLASAWTHAAEGWKP